MQSVIVHMSAKDIDPTEGEPFVRVYGPFDEEAVDVYVAAAHLEQTRGGQAVVRNLRDPRVLLDGPVNAS